MPIYEYFCPECRSKFELLRAMNCASDDAFCPTCHTKGQKRLSTFSSMSKDADGVATPVGGFDKCTGCSQSTCSFCG